MKTIRVYALPSHQSKERNSGVDYARVVSPMSHLNGFTTGDYTFQVDTFDIHTREKDNWLEIAKTYDLVFFNYTVLDWNYAAMASVVHGLGKKIIMDIDDAIWYVAPDNIVHDRLKELNAGYIITCILDDVDGVVTTNRYLKNVIADKTYKRHEQIQVIENQIDIQYYPTVFPPKDEKNIVLMHYGSTSHFNDLQDEAFLTAMKRIFAEYPNVTFKSVGAFIADLRYTFGSRYENAFGDIDIFNWMKYKFPEYMAEADIMVVPLKNTIYNRCKSDIKFLETASAMKPGIFSDVRPYSDTILNRQTGFLASTADEWYVALKHLIDNFDERQRIAENAHAYVMEHRQMKQHVQEYADYILKVLQSY